MSTVANLAAGLTVAAALVSPAPLEAQQQASSHWTASAGRATFAFRDVSRAIRPVDASPIAWEGSGPALRARYDRTSRVSMHRVDFTWARTAGFTFTSPIRRVAAATGDNASSLHTRYEYRRYFFRDLGVRGFDLGASAEARFARVSRQRVYASFVARDRSRNIMAGGALGARLQRWPRLALEASWTNGLWLRKWKHEFDDAVPAPRSGWGGGWYDEWLTTGRLRLAGRTSLFVEHVLTSDVLYAHHASSTGRERTLLLGVSYAR